MLNRNLHYLLELKILTLFVLDTCRVSPSIRDWIPDCYGKYSRSNEESRSFLPGWTTNITSQNYSSSINEAFIYQTSQQLDTSIYMGEFATYSSGGYVYELRDSPSKIRADLSQLHQLGWIDIQTRAVIIQMNLYNPNIPIFTSVGIIIELLPSGGVFPNAGFEPLYTSGKYSSFIQK
jgi:polycystin 1L2